MTSKLALPPLEMSLMERLALLPEQERMEILADFTKKQLRYTWQLWARPKQLPPPGFWSTWVIRSGRGHGKTRTGAEYTIERAKQGKGPIALIGQTVADVRDTMVEMGESSIMNVVEPDFKPLYEPSKRRLTFPNGVVATTFSGDRPDQLRGPQHATIWSDELCKWKYPEDAYSNAVLGLRVGEDPTHLITTTPRPMPLLRQILADPMTVDVTGSSYENMANLSPIFIENVIRMYEGTRLGRQELRGDILEDTPGALWTYDSIEAHRVRHAPELWRIGIGVDPKASTNANSETGIIAAGISREKHGYVLGDYSIDGTPKQWAQQIIRAYNLSAGDFIIAEVNQGGDMVEAVIRLQRDENDKPIGTNLPIYQVHASRGKQTRAEPVANLYEQGRVHHVGQYAQLEDQMCTWVPQEDPTSPDRMDALVWVLSALMLPQPRKASTKKRRGARKRRKKTAA